MSLNLAFHRKGGTPQRQKYGNKKVVYDGIEFDSELEKNRYIFLRGAEEAGEIEHLQCHVSYEIIPKVTTMVEKQLKTKTKLVERVLFSARKFTPDFIYVRNGKTVAEDVKGSKFVVSKDFPLRRHLLYVTHRILCTIVYRANAPLSEGL